MKEGNSSASTPETIEALKNIKDVLKEQVLLTAY